MLKQEQARTQLEKIRNDAWVATRLGAAANLPENLRDTARSILPTDEDESALRAMARQAKSQELAKVFRAIDETARLQLFETLAPGLGVVIERGWQLFDRLAFQAGYSRKPFRAPGHPEALIARRMTWLMDLLGIIGPYQQSLAWFAAWAPHLAYYTQADNLGILLAAAIEHGGNDGEEVFQILCASARNEHDIGGMGRHVTRALLCASRPDGWEFVEKMLLAAQREEGLRQTILETIDEAHPQAFRRMLRLILEENLARFSATVRAFDVWLGYQWDAVSAGVVKETVEKMLLYLEDAAARTTAVEGKDAEQVYLALWSQAFDDGVAAVAPATALLKHPKAEHRFVAAHLLDQLGLLASEKSLLTALEDSDLRVATRALLGFQRGTDARIIKLDLFERLEKLLPRLPDKAQKLKPTVWPWTAYTVSKELAANVLPRTLGERPPTRLIPYLRQMGTSSRAAVIQMLAQQSEWTSETRDTLFALIGDASRSVREAALRHLGKCQITPDEAVAMEKLLDRKTGDLRRGVMTLLMRQTDEAAVLSADRLLGSSSRPQRLAGLELLRQLLENKRCIAEVQQRARGYAELHPKLNEAERQQLDVVLNAGQEKPTLDNALGLLRHDERTWPPSPVPRSVQFHSLVVGRLISAIEELLKAHAQDVVTYVARGGEEWKGLLADIGLGFPHPDPQLRPEEDRKRLPLAELWESWWQTREADLRDEDGMEALRALAWFQCGVQMEKAFPEATKIVLGNNPGAKAAGREMWRVRDVLLWLVRLHPQVGAAEFALDAAEAALALVPKNALQLTPEDATELKQLQSSVRDVSHEEWWSRHERLEEIQAKMAWRQDESPHGVWLKIAEQLHTYASQLWTPALHIRHWNLLRWLDEPARPKQSGGNSGVSREVCLPRSRAGIIPLALAFSARGATEADILDQVLGERETISTFGTTPFYELRALSARKPPAEYNRFEFLFPIADKCRKRILEVELTRGDTPTAASAPALSLSSVEGVWNLMAILRALAQRNFVRGYAQDNESSETVFSHLVRCCFPLAGETATDFARAARAANMSETRLIELAVYAPQWAHFVEHTLGWQSLTEAVWWIHAHTKGEDWTVAREIRELWDADMSARTSLSAADLLEGAVDVAWFLRVYKELGAKRWSALYEAAKFASSGAGHARAQLFADAMLDKASKRELGQRALKKRYQDAVRALGLLPLADGKKREADLLDRYKTIQEFRRGSKQFGSMRQASEKRAAQIGQQNLARTAGYADPIRLEWAMEAKAVEDLAEGPLEVAAEDVTLTLAIDPWGEIDLRVAKAGKPLADVPARLKKHPKVAALRERKVELKRQAARIRPSLEQFMARGDEFSAAELRELMKHPLLAPMLKNLVLTGDGIMGYPVHGGKALENQRGEVDALKTAERLRIAHPHDLLPAKEWHAWQKDCLARERIQPFKQIFREFYPLTDTEKAEGKQTRRYAGHQVQPRQALALLGQRGWVHHPEEGVRKVFHEAGLVAWLHFQEGFFTPAEIEGLTLESVFFTKRDQPEAVTLEQLPPRLFSEAMRDLDLVVSVAHRGGVDPEASASTIEMRASLVGQTAQLLKLKNVQLKDRYALIKGELGEYSVHLGSAVTRKMPGETLFLIPVHSQHRGRLFLPFADDDPRTAEVMSKVLLLARDKEIKDPNILEQLRQ